jgi:general secretion pathway protein G
MVMATETRAGRGGFADWTEARAAGQGWPVCGFDFRTKSRAAGQGRPVCGFDFRTKSRAAGQGRPVCGFTLIELLVVMSVIALLLTLAVPRYLGSVDKSKEAVLKENLALMRDAIDKHYGDHGRYPDELADLVSRKYLRRIPPDPITESATTWIVVPAEDTRKGMVFDVRSGATERSRNGESYGDW